MAPLVHKLLSDSEPDHPRTPNHYCIGAGRPKCNTPKLHPKRQETGDYQYSAGVRTCSTAIACFDNSDMESANSHFCLRVLELSNSDIVRVNSALDSEPDPPHVCKDIPCEVCGRKWF